MSDDGWVAEVTGSGRAALHAVMVGGPAAEGWLQQCFRGNGSTPHGNLVDESGEVIDDVVWIRWPGEESQHLLTLHGSPWLREEVVQRFERLGAVRRGDRDDLLQMWSPEADADAGVAGQALSRLPAAISSEGCAFLLEQASSIGLAGWLTRALKETPTIPELQHLLDRSAEGIGVLSPSRVVIAGVPNAGKSTLFNLLVGTDRTLVSERPGTTRDLIEEVANFDGYPLRLVDGAGLHDSADEVEQEGMKRMRVAAAAAQLVIVLIPPGGEELVEPSWGDSRERTLVFHSRRDEDPGGNCAGPGISATTGEGIEQLISKVIEQLYDVERIPRRQPRLFLPSHRYWIERTIEALESGFDGKGPLSRLHLPEETR